MILNTFLKNLNIIFLHVIFLFFKYLNFDLPFLMALSTIINVVFVRLFLYENKNEKYIEYIKSFLLTFICFFFLNFIFSKVHFIVFLIIVVIFFQINHLMWFVFISYPCDFLILSFLTISACFVIIGYIYFTIKFLIQNSLTFIESILEKIFFIIKLKPNQEFIKINKKSSKKTSPLKNVENIDSCDELIICSIIKIVYFVFCIAIEKKYEKIELEKNIKKQIYISNMTVFNPKKMPYISCLKKIEQIQAIERKKYNFKNRKRKLRLDLFFSSVFKYIFQK